MKKLVLILGVVMTPVMYSLGQDFKATVTEKGNAGKTISQLDKEKLNDYSVTIYYSGSSEKTEALNLYRLTEKVSINGAEANADLWTSYKKEDFNGSSAFKSDYDFGDVIMDNAGLAKETGNTLKVELINEEDNSVIATAEITFNVPGFNNYESEFCGELYNLKSTDKRVDQTLHTIFKAVYPHEEIVLTLMDDEWDISEERGDWNTYVIIFKNKGQLWSLRYTTSYIVEDGKLLDMPRVKIYNGLDDPKPVPPSCFENLKANLK